MQRKLVRDNVIVYAMLNHLAYIRDRIIYLFTRVDVESLEMFLVFTSLWTGMRFVYNGPSLTPFMALLSAQHPLWMWGWLAVASSIVMLIGLIENVSVLRRVGILGGCLFWYYSGGVLIVHYPLTYVPGLHLIVGSFATWCYCRIGILEVQMSHRKAAPQRSEAIANPSFPVSL